MTEEFLVGCPKCSSTQITANKKGFSGGKAVAGAVLTGGIGLLAGFHGKDKVIITCLSCGNNFKSGEGKKIIVRNNHTEPQKQKPIIEFKSSTESGELNRIVCSKCNTENFLSHRHCKSCGNELTEDDKKINSLVEVKLIACKSCKKLRPLDSKFCPHCLSTVEANKNSGCAGVLASIIFLTIVFYLLT